MNQHAVIVVKATQAARAGHPGVFALCSHEPGRMYYDQTMRREIMAPERLSRTNLFGLGMQQHSAEPVCDVI